MAMLLMYPFFMFISATAAAIGNETVRLSRHAEMSNVILSNKGREEKMYRLQRFHNPEVALMGYDLTKSDIMSNNGDPGKRGQIFDALIKPSGKLHPLFSRDFSVNCNAHISTKIITNGKEFSQYMSEQTSSGNYLQFAQSLIKDVGVIPPAFTTGWSEQSLTQSLTEWLSKEKGLLAITGASCIEQTLSFTKYHMPPFTVAFKRAIKDLHKATRTPYSDKALAFKKFINAFGTHYSTKTRMGARFSIIFKLRKLTRMNMSPSKLKDCSTKQGAKFFGLQLDDDRNKCTAADENMVRKTGSSWSDKIVITTGTYPEENLSKWVAAIKSGRGLAPLNYELHPITELLSDDVITEQKLRVNGKNITGIKSWVDQLYNNFCHTMNMKNQCVLKQGCGHTDDCNYNEDCVNKLVEPRGTFVEYSYKCTRCRCINLINKDGNGNCNKRWCYISLPSTCEDRNPSGYYPGRYTSYQACRKDMR